jgi:hypothetical protein
MLIADDKTQNPPRLLQHKTFATLELQHKKTGYSYFSSQRDRVDLQFDPNEATLPGTDRSATPRSFPSWPNKLENGMECNATSPHHAN